MKRAIGEPVFVDRWGYMMVVAPPGHPSARCKGVGNGSRGGSRGYIRRSRHVMELHLGRFLTKHEPVHHVNGNKQDDRLENLRILTHSEHSKIHWNNPRKREDVPIIGENCRNCPKIMVRPWDGKRGLCNGCYIRAKRLKIVGGSWPEWAE